MHNVSRLSFGSVVERDTFIHRPTPFADIPLVGYTHGLRLPFFRVLVFDKEQWLNELVINPAGRGGICIVEGFNGWTADMVGFRVTRSRRSCLVAAPVHCDANQYLAWRYAVALDTSTPFPLDYLRTRFFPSGDGDVFQYERVPRASRLPKQSVA